MPSFTLDEVMQALGTATVLEEKLQNFRDVVTDTRKITEGALFVALKGERFNGENFAKDAIEKGAAGVLVSNGFAYGEPLQGTVIMFDGDTQTAYQLLARFHRRRFDIPVIAITGSNGKTTTKDLTAAVLSAKFNVLKTQANFNNEIGLPLTLLQLNKSHEAAVVEIGMRGLHQIEALALMAEPDIGIITNVGETHIELLGSIENIAQAKGEMAEAIPAGGTLIINNDNPYTAAMYKKAKPGVKVITFGLEKDADIKASDIVSDGSSTTFKCQLGKGGAACMLTIPMLGNHNVANALAAVAAGYALGLNTMEIAQGLDSLEMTGMRFETSRKGNVNIINDAYNASPMSMEAALRTLGEITKGKGAIAVLGDMLELGDVAVSAHEKVGQQAAEAGVKALVTLGQLGEKIAAGAKAAGLAEVYTTSTHAEAAEVLKTIVKPEDTVLFKGSRGMQMEKIIELL